MSGVRFSLAPPKMKFDLIGFILKLENIKIKTSNDQMVNAFFSSSITTEIYQEKVGIEAIFHQQHIPLETLLHIYKLCEDYAIGEVFLYTYNEYPTVSINKNLQSEEIELP